MSNPETGPSWTIKEKNFLQLVRNAAHLAGWRTYHTYDSRRSEEGWPDLVLCKPPRLLIVELKSQSGRLRPSQVEWLDALTRCGIECHVWRPSDWQTICKVLGIPTDDICLPSGRLKPLWRQELKTAGDGDT